MSKKPTKIVRTTLRRFNGKSESMEVTFRYRGSLEAYAADLRHHLSELGLSDDHRIDISSEGPTKGLVLIRQGTKGSGSYVIETAPVPVETTPD